MTIGRGGMGGAKHCFEFCVSIVRLLCFLALFSSENYRWIISILYMPQTEKYCENLIFEFKKKVQTIQ